MTGGQAPSLGKGVRVAIIDSGVNPAHPHVNGVAGGVRISAWSESPDFTDTLGHGTAVAGAIREAAPEADLFAVKIFDQAIAARFEVLQRALAWCLDHQMHVINLSLGTSNPAYTAPLQALVDRAVAQQVALVSAYEMQGQLALPGSLPGVLGVKLADHAQRGLITQEAGIFRAAGWPRPIPGRAVEQNLYGISFAVAAVSGLATLAYGEQPWQSLATLPARMLALAGQLEFHPPAHVKTGRGHEC